MTSFYTLDCPQCGFGNANGAHLCERCGTALSETCPACGQPLGVAFEFCPACGTRLGETPTRSVDELKTVTILFSDWVGSTALGENLDPEALRFVQERYFDQAAAVILRHGGTVEKFIGDAVMAVFGVPQVHEDDALRAVRAAVELRDALAALNEHLQEQLGVRIATRTGLNTGEVVAGDPAAGQAFVTGDPVVVAKRLEEAAAPGEILVGETTFGLTRDAIVAEPVPHLALKGKRAAAQAWRLIATVHGAPGHVRQLDQKIVDRERELELLRNTFTLATRDRTPQLITLVGVPGVGKTRLVAELAATLDGRSEAVAWHVGRCMPYGEAASFAALAELARSITGIYENEGYRTAAAKLRASIESVLEPAEARWVERHLRPLIGLHDDPDQPRDQRGEAFAAWSRFLEAFAERLPLVLLFEDLHWADDDLRDFIEHFVGWATDVPVVVIGTTRPELIERRPGWGAGKRNALTISLAPLSTEHTRELLSALLEKAISPAVTDALVVRAEGNPFYAEEFVRMLVERGLLGRADDVAGGDVHDSLPLPETVQGIIAARLDALSSSEKSLLQDAAVVGRVFWVGAVAAVGGLDPSLVETQLRALESKEFVRRDRRSSMVGEAQYAFLHVLVRDVAYGQIPRTNRAERHQRAARWLQSPDTADRPEIRAEMLAHHYLSALEYARPAGVDRGSLEAQARSALVEAGDRAHALHAHAAAEHLYSVALDLAAPDDEGRPELLFKYGRSRFDGAEQGAEELTEAAALLLAQGNRELAAEAEMMLCALLVSQGDRAGAIGRLERANELVSSAGPSRAKAYVLATSARYRMLAAQDDEAVRLGREALAMSERLGFDDVSAQALNNIGVSRVVLGDEAGIEDLQRAISIAREINSPELARGYRFLASVVGIHGELERSYELFAEGRRAAERFADAHNARPLAASYVSELYWRGEWDDAVTKTNSFIEESRAGSPHYHEIPCRRVRGQIRLAREDPAGADEDSEVGLAFARTARDPWFLNAAMAFRARVLLAEGRTDEAASLVDELLALLDSPRRVGLGADLVELSMVLVDLGRGEELARLVGGLEQPTRWAAAAGAFAGGDFGAAVAAYAEIGARPDEAFARLRLAEQLVERGRHDDAESALRPALAFYQQVRATALLRDAETLAASLGNTAG